MLKINWWKPGNINYTGRSVKERACVDIVQVKLVSFFKKKVRDNFKNVITMMKIHVRDSFDFDRLIAQHKTYGSHLDKNMAEMLAASSSPSSTDDDVPLRTSQ